jgi:hypothetical protein
MSGTGTEPIPTTNLDDSGSSIRDVSSLSNARAESPSITNVASTWIELCGVRFIVKSGNSTRMAVFYGVANQIARSVRARFRELAKTISVIDLSIPGIDRISL